jgi:hypothetical protein
MNMFGSLNYQAYMGSQNIEANEHLAQTLMGVTYGGLEVTNEKIDVDEKYALGMTWDTPLNGLRLGGTYQIADMQLTSAYDFPAYPPFFPASAGTYYIDSRSENYVVSAEYTWNNLLVAAEYMWADRRIEYDNAYWGPTVEYHKPDGWYLGAAYRFIDWFELGGYYSAYWAERNNRDGKDENPNFPGTLLIDPSHRAWLKDICLTTRFDVTEYLVIKLEGHQFNGSGQLSGFDNLIPDDGSDQFEKNWQMYALKATFSF